MTVAKTPKQPKPQDPLAKKLHDAMLGNLQHNAAHPGTLDAARFEKNKHGAAKTQQQPPKK